MIRTFIDSGVLLAAPRGTEACSETALTILEDQEREFASSKFVRLEVLPKAVYCDRKIEVQFYESFFSAVNYWAGDLEKISKDAYKLAYQDGLSAIDSLHIAAALALGSEEFITTEKSTKPMHRVSPNTKTVQDSLNATQAKLSRFRNEIRWHDHWQLNLLFSGAAAGGVAQAEPGYQ